MTNSDILQKSAGKWKVAQDEKIHFDLMAKGANAFSSFVISKT